MARYTESVCKLCRRCEVKLMLKGNRCMTPKCAMERQKKGGVRGRRRRVSDRGLQLTEKQKVRYSYGLMEKQFRRVFEQASKHKGITGDNLLILLERRIDNVVFRLGFAANRAQARNLVTHGHFTVNGRRTDIPSMLLKEGDRIEVREGSRALTYFKDLAPLAEKRTSPSWLTRDVSSMNGSVSRMPDRPEIEGALNEQLIVEYYSRR